MAFVIGAIVADVVGVVIEELLTPDPVSFKCTAVGNEKGEDNVAKLEATKSVYKSLEKKFTAFENAEKCIQGNDSKLQILQKYRKILNDMQLKRMKVLSWLQEKLASVSTEKHVCSQSLTKEMLPLKTGIDNLKSLANDVDAQNKKTEQITTEQLEVFRQCLLKVCASLKSLTTYINQKKTKELASFPINEEDVCGWEDTLKQ